MKINWNYSLETEAERIVHTARQMIVGFYRLNGFNVLPYQEENSVYLPELEYNKIPRFWEKMKKIDVYHLPIVVEEEIVEWLVAMLQEKKYNAPNISLTNEVWDKLEEEFFKSLGEVILGAKNLIKSITVHPTLFGTKMSFNVLDSDRNDLIVYLRDDQDVTYGLAEAILSAVTRDSFYKNLEGSWQESEILVDWLISESSIGRIINKYHDLENFRPTIKGTRMKQQARMLKESEDYYRKLGIVNVDLPNRKVEGMTTRESLIFDLLKQNINTVVSFDEIAKLMSGTEDDFSLYAISKIIQRIRDKMEMNGISGSFVQTMRGKGYMLRN